MTPVDFFDEGAGGFLTAASLNVGVQMIGVTLALLYMVFVAISAYREWGNERIKAGDLTFLVFRALAALMVLLYLFTI